ncbi:MAG: enoyl-CoA hydratase/isomerase family protein [Deltaproteobacteria bacterium]|nr:enoyl-CoA hydratase/isomerase family protein [Deltaproteobacteria bacterium]
MECIILEKNDDGIAQITFNRPEAYNALNIQTRAEFTEAMNDVTNDDSVKVIVLTGAGKSFIAGSDIKEMQATTPIMAHNIVRLGEIIENCPKPVIAKINGFALGGGCEVAMACDILVAHEKAKFGQPEINLGIIPGGGGTQRLARLVGMAKAKELIYTGDMIKADEAERIGLINKVVPIDELDACVQEIAVKIAKKSIIAVKLCKAAINRGAQVGLESGLKYERELYSISLTTEDKQEGVAAFVEKREANFKGK